MQRDDSWITAHYFDGTGRAEKSNGTLMSDDLAGDRPVWIQLNMNEFAAQLWLREESGLSEVVIEALLADETRPRCLVVDDGVLVNLRGVNLNPGADPVDMVAIRLWSEKDKVVSVQRRRLRAVNDVEKHLAEGNGPKDIAEFLADLTDGLAERMSHVIGEINERVDQLEETILDENEKKCVPICARCGARSLVSAATSRRSAKPWRRWRLRISTGCRRSNGSRCVRPPID